MAARYTLIIPVPEYRPDWPVLIGLQQVPPPHDSQILLAVGQHPTRQRNAALELSYGEIIVFLDSDSEPDEHFWARLDVALEQTRVQVVGGPTLLRTEASWWEQVFQLLLGHAFVVGPIAARYNSFGDFRVSSQSELILCNLVVRRSVFEQIGIFSPELFPNEENEWLDRAQGAGIGIYHDPTLLVRRPQRPDLATFLKTMVRYGIGRTHQFLLNRKVTVHQGVPLFVIFLTLFLIYNFGSFLPFFIVIGWALYSFLIYLSAPHDAPQNVRIIAAGLGPLVPICYIAGQLAGFFVRGPGQINSPITVLNEQGQELVAAAPESI